MIVYGSSLSPYVRKVIVFAAEKGVAIENPNTAPGDMSPEFREASPFGTIPAMRDGDFTLCDSSAIVTYIEALHPERALIPQAPRDHARVIWFDEFGDTILGGVGIKIFFNRVVAPVFRKIPGDVATADKAENEELPLIADYLESIAPDSGFLIGDQLTLADIAVASPWVNLNHLGIRLDPASHPKAAAYVEGILSRPSFASLVEREKAFLKRFDIGVEG